MRTIKTLKQALTVSTSQLTVSNILNGQIYTSRGLEKFKVTDELKESLAEEVSQLYGGRYTTRKQVFNSLRYGGVKHWGLDRTFIESRKDQTDKRKKIITVSYCAGQYYPYELNIIRNALR